MFKLPQVSPDTLIRLVAALLNFAAAVLRVLDRRPSWWPFS